MKKQFISLLLAVCLMLSLSACGSKTPESPAPAPEQSQTENQTAQPQTPAEPENKPLEGSDFSLTQREYPRVDGSTATIPLSEGFYARVTGCSAEQAALNIKHNMTHEAYVNLIDGNCDIIFVTSPSEEELKYAKEQGVSLKVVPVVSEAFVFLVSKDNPVEGLTHQQILDIYSGKVTNWSQVGGSDTPIRAFQRPVNSGSQTGMIDLVMGDTPLAEAPTDLVTAFMGELVDAVAAYDAAPDAIGYSYYYYVNDMWGYNRTKLLAIDGVAPNNETVADGSYRYHTAYYAVVREGEPEDSKAYRLLDWILSPDGQQTAENSGYVKAGK